MSRDEQSVPLNGVLVVDKPASVTSHDVVQRVRRASRMRRVGHTGTLDPFATGVLPLVLGRATRLARFLSREERLYRAIVRFGQATDTGDPTGQPSGPAMPVPDEARIASALAHMKGRIRQRPPAFSAKRIGGQRAYRLARRGQAVEVEPVWVTIHRLELLRALSASDFELEIACSSGTYIRSLATDLAIRLDSAAHVLALKRLRCGSFSLEQAVSLDPLPDPGEVEACLVPLEELPLGLASLTLPEADAHRFCHGASVELSLSQEDGELRRVLDARGRLLGVGRLEPLPTGQACRLLPEIVTVDQSLSGRAIPT